MDVNQSVLVTVLFSSICEIDDVQKKETDFVSIKMSL